MIIYTIMIDSLIDFILELFKIENETLACSLVHIVFKIFVPLILLVVPYKTIMLCIYRILAKIHLTNNKKIKIIFWTRTLLRIIFISLFILIVKILFGEDFIKYLKILFSVVNQPFYSAGNNSISLLTLIMIIPIYYLALWLGKITYKIVNAAFLGPSLTNINRQEIDTVYLGNLNIFLKSNNNKTSVAAKVFKYCVIAFIFIVGLSLLGINLSSLAVILGVLGIGLGFGLQNLVANIFAGFVIMITKVIREGDFINVREDRGTVTKINSISSIITTRFNEKIIIPNSVLISDIIYNDSYEDRTVVIENNVMVSYDSDIDLVRSILSEIAKRSPYSKKSEEPDSRILKFDRAGIDIVLYSTINEVVERGPAKAWINLEIWREFKKNNIIIPVSQMEVNVKKEEKL